MRLSTLVDHLVLTALIVFAVVGVVALIEAPSVPRTEFNLDRAYAECARRVGARTAQTVRWTAPPLYDTDADLLYTIRVACPDLAP